MGSLLELIKALSIPVLSLLFALTYLVSTRSLPGISANYPRGLILIIVFLGVWLILSELKKRLKERHLRSSRKTPLREFSRPIIVQVLLLFYFVTIPYVGFYLNSLVWMVITSLVIDKRIRWKRLGHDILISMVFVAGAYVVFKILFSIPTPTGLWL